MKIPTVHYPAYIATRLIAGNKNLKLSKQCITESSTTVTLTQVKWGELKIKKQN